MTTADQYSIARTTDPLKIEACARMMSATDPWITYSMDYSRCLKAFDGEGREIYVLEDANSVAGFVILQVLGIFKGYVQTLCISEMHRNKGLGKKLLQFSEDRILNISP